MVLRPIRMLLRPYQLSMIERIRGAFKRGVRRVCAVAPTGSGKTVMAAEMMRAAVARGRRVLFLVHRVELVDQAVARLADFGVPAGEIIGERDEDRSRHVQVASVQTLVRRDLPPAEFVFVDECHHAISDSYVNVLSGYPSAWICGLSATPARLDGKPLREVFDELVIGVTPEELCQSGVLVRPLVYSHPEVPDLSGLKIRAGDFEQDKLGEMMSDRKFVGAIVPHWVDRANGARTVAYAVNIAHSLLIVDAFASAGISAAHLDGSTPLEDRRAILSALRSGDLRVVSNCMVLTEGWDLPELEVAILARPTASMVLYRQMVGRIMRTAPGKDGCTVLDHAGNARRHGLVTDHVEWSLDGEVRSKGVTPYRTCPECFAVIPAGCAKCPECGYVAEVAEREEATTEAPGKLVKYDPVDRAAWYRAAVEHASLRGWKLGKARRDYKDKFGVWPKALKHLEGAYVCRDHRPVRGEWGIRCERCLKRT